MDTAIPTFDISVLPASARRELLDFYDFLVHKYAVKQTVKTMPAKAAIPTQDAVSESARNDAAFIRLLPELERLYPPGKWIVIAHGELQGTADTVEDLSGIAPEAKERLVWQMGLQRPEQVEVGWQIAFA